MPSGHPCGRLSGSCRPEAERCAVRASRPHRATFPESRAAHIQPLQTALHRMQGQWPHVRTDITGAAGRAMIRAIVAGERDPVQLARFRAPRGARRPAESAKA
jgi:transposase